MFGLIMVLIESADSLPCASDMQCKCKEPGKQNPFNCNGQYTSCEGVVLCTYTHT